MPRHGLDTEALPASNILEATDSIKDSCEVAMNTKTVGMIFAIFLLTIPILACAGGGSSGSGSGSATSSKSSGHLELLPDDTVRLEVLKVGDILGGAVPESFETQFESQWEPYSLGDDIVTIDDISEMVRAYSKDGEILMLSGSQIDFAGVRDWLSDEDEGNIERTSYQGQDLWGDDRRGMVILDGYLIQGDTEALKEILKVKARGEGSLNQASENALKKAYEDARAGWYVMASENCDEFSSDLRSCEGYSVSGGQGEEDYLVAVAYRFQFSREQRAESQSLDIEDWLDDRDWDIDLDEVKVDGAFVEVRASGDEEDFRTEWLVSYHGIGTPSPLPTAVPDESSTSNGTNTARASGQPMAAPAATSTPRATAAVPTSAPTSTPWVAPTAAPPATATEAPDITAPPGRSHPIGTCTSQIEAAGFIKGSWRNDCPSTHSHSSLGAGYYYRFEIGTTQIRNLVSIHLATPSDRSPVPIELLLLQGPIGNERVLAKDSGLRRAQIVSHELLPGVYTIEVAANVIGPHHLIFDLTH